MLVRQKMMTGIILVSLMILVIAATAYTLMAKRLLEQDRVPDMPVLIVSLVQSKLNEADSDLKDVQSLMSQVSLHSRIRELALYDDSGHRIAYSLRDTQSPALTVNLHDISTDLLTTRVTLRQAESSLTLVMIRANDLPQAFFLAFYSTTLLVTAISVLLIYLLYALLRRWQQQPYRHLLDTISERVNSNSDELITLTNNDPDLQALTDTLNDLFWVRNQRTLHLQTAHRQAENARKRATRLSTETRQMNDNLAKEVSIRRSVETQLKHTQTLLDSILNAMPTGLFALDINNRIVQCNEQAGTWLGCDHHQLTGLMIDRLIPELAEHDLLGVTDKDDSSIRREQRLALNSLDEPLITDVMIYPLPPGQTARRVIRIDDITQRQRMEEVMVQTEKMMTVGGLAAGMAHEINNPLGAILQNLQNIRRRLQPELPANERVAAEHNLNLEQVQTYLEQREVLKFFDHIQDAGERAAGIVANMLQFARNDQTQKRKLRIGSLLEETLTIAATDLSLGEVITDYTDLTENLEIRCVPSEIQQVLLNLLRNASQALEEADAEGRLYGRTPEITLQATFTADHAIFRVIDNGPGVPPNIMPRIFEPFFTTKEVGEGTGLGLSVSYFIVTSHHKGVMRCLPGPKGIGACFEVRLPLKSEV